MAHIDMLLTAMDDYARARNAVQTESSGGCSDWDCGIANEMSDVFAAQARREELRKAKQALEAALDNYIDDRVQAAVRKLAQT